jgi:hypothetical protein
LPEQLQYRFNFSQYFSAILPHDPLTGGRTEMDDRRKHVRIRTLKSGKIVFNRRLNVIDCIVRNMSDGGACVQLQAPDWLPEKFELTIPIDGLNRLCRLRWKQADRVGVAYV